MTAHRTLLAVFFAAIAVTTAAADWPQFRGPGLQGKSAETGLPTTWSATQNIAWKTELPGAGTSSPIAIDGRLLVRSDRYLYALANN